MPERMREFSSCSFPPKFFFQSLYAEKKIIADPIHKRQLFSLKGPLRVQYPPQLPKGVYSLEGIILQKCFSVNKKSPFYGVFIDHP